MNSRISKVEWWKKGGLLTKKVGCWLFFSVDFFLEKKFDPPTRSADQTHTHRTVLGWIFGERFAGPSRNLFRAFKKRFAPIPRALEKFSRDHRANLPENFRTHPQPSRKLFAHPSVFWRTHRAPVRKRWRTHRAPVRKRWREGFTLPQNVWREVLAGSFWREVWQPQKVLAGSSTQPQKNVTKYVLCHP